MSLVLYLILCLHGINSFRILSPFNNNKFPSLSKCFNLQVDQNSPALAQKFYTQTSTSTPTPAASTDEITAKSVTKEIMAFFSAPSSASPLTDSAFKSRLLDEKVKKEMDGLHVITIFFQSARTKRLSKNIVPINFIVEKLKQWDVIWSERDISTFVYGIRSLECINKIDSDLIKFGAKKIAESSAVLSSRAIGNALYGLQEITSDIDGIPELCSSLASKIKTFRGDLNGQDIGIGLYGMQGLSADDPNVRELIGIFAEKIKSSESELDAQGMSNALYGLQSMSSDYPEVLALVSALATKISESKPKLSAQAIGSALYGLQKLSSEPLEVRTLISALAEKVDKSTVGLDAQAVGNALFGLQRMQSNGPEVRSLVQAIATKLDQIDIEMDSKGIGSALYGLKSMSSDSPQVQFLMGVLAKRIAQSKCYLSGQSIADALYGLNGMTTDCVQLRSLLVALASRIDSGRGKLDSQEIGNALFGLQGLSSEMAEVRIIVNKLADKIKRSKAVLRAQHIGRALLGLQRFTAQSKEVRYLLQQLTKRIAESDRTKMTGSAIADTLFGLQGFSENVPEVQELVGELAKKIAVTAAEMTASEFGRALYGLQGLRSSASIFQESAIGLASDEVQFLLSTLWDKARMRKGRLTLSASALGLQGLTYLNDPIAVNLKQYLYAEIIRIGTEKVNPNEKETEGTKTPSYNKVINKLDSKVTPGPMTTSNPAVSVARGVAPTGTVIYTNNVELTINPIDVVAAVRSLRLNNYLVPKWLAVSYIEIEKDHANNPIVPLSRADKLVTQKYVFLHPQEKLITNKLIDGFQLDIEFPDIKLNVELDGPTHRFPARARFDRARDEYLTSKKGYKVERVLLEGKSVDEIVAEIKSLVIKRTEEYAEIEIQRMYSADVDIRKLYSKKP